MTEQEAIETLKTDCCYECSHGCHGMANCTYRECEVVQSVRLAIKALGEIQQYREIGTPEECSAAVEKQKAKKPIEPDEEYGTFKCPSCGGLIFTEDRFETHKYCLLCGQKLDWSDE